MPRAATFRTPPGFRAVRLARAPFAAVAAFVAMLPASLSAGPPATVLEEKAGQAWRAAWDRFFHPDTHTFMDYVSSYEPGKELAHLPTAGEVGRQYPNPCGYGTGMEDGMILGGAMLSLICDRFAVTEEESLRADAARVFDGMRRCATVHGVPGFVARNVCPQDRKSIYINSSRDQYTHFVHGLWTYHRSPLPDEATREEIRRLLAAVADRMIEFATPARDFDFGRADGARCPLGICRMWNVQAHEAARLPMIHAAAWQATGAERYRKLWRDHAPEAARQSASPDERLPAYALLQMQASLELLRPLEPAEDVRNAISDAMRRVGDLAERRFALTMRRLAQKSADDMRMTGPDWRQAKEWKDQKGYRIPQWGPYREVWQLTREAGESALVVLMADPGRMSADRGKALRDMMTQTDYPHTSGCGIVFHLAAYWKARRHGVLP